MKAMILGGVKSGKSRYAERLARDISDSVTVVATAQALDEEMADRIARHQQDRPEGWRTVESPLYLAETLDTLHEAEVVIVDCLTLWLTNLLMQENKTLLELEVSKLNEAVERFPTSLILVSNETNMGIMPLGELTRKYCDAAGLLHQRLAKVCDRVELIVAGLPLTLKVEFGV